MFSKFKNIVIAGGWLLSLVAGISANAVPAPTRPSQEVSEKDGIPVLIKHLPDWENVQSSTIFTTNRDGLKAALRERQILDLVDFSTGTEVVVAQYNVGRLLIIEYTSPQVSVDADAKFIAALANDPEAGTTAYRRIGNYNAFVFDAANISAANALLDEVKYEKQIHWLGDNPFILSPERAFILTTADIFFSTLLVIVMGIVFAIIGGLIVGLVYFMLRGRRRAAMTAFTDAGGMTRLNLDGFTPDVVPDRLLGDR